MSYSALILAGGRATRMGGQDKGLLELFGQPLIAHTLAALAAQTPPPARILISANRHLDIYRAFGHPVLPDTLPDYPGPLAGLLAGLAAAPHDTLLMLPCDAVRLPAELASRLLAALEGGLAAASASDPEHWHPTLLALRPGLQGALEAYLAGGGRSIRGWLATLEHRIVPFDQALPNLNTPDALAALAAAGPAGLA
ncbi:molybdenum cofactor guanylyltransferase MobA [Pseudogulbenkiania ferrooxidans]|uniref:Molybdenum cofactor guanylyltransferase n=1 Tax=Pseudogulbenkiania ferrooxidans 2002 TaxID=279714 RepID=B9Z7K9_9NEIS|nr:molybdenum cofactor guanylyltransferase MobA [Pseudogulbenkiania ferrooxidans]EEG07145.1 molybdopterin-guanine dinucleotide biosynthesis protein A [Pseudogulbenkiania ferrooxidans 2002]